jgi:hypothetical protein
MDMTLGRDGRRRGRVRAVTVACAVLGAGTLVGLGTAHATGVPAWRDDQVTAGPAVRDHRLPPADAGFDYQIGEAYAPPSGVGIVTRDHTVRPAAGKYNVCYVNGFQTQTEAAQWWRRNYDDLLLRRNGRLVVDGDWDEILLDTSTAGKRERLAGVVGAWIDECADRGYQAVEIDNLDSWQRSQHMLTMEHAIAYATLLVAHAHRRGLAAAQKNSAEHSDVMHRRVGFDLAVAESCADYEGDDGELECQGYVDVYGDHVLVIEYDSAHFRLACQRYGARLSIVRRDRDVSAPGSDTYVFKVC